MTTTQRDTDPQHLFLSAVREGQDALVDVLRVWSDVGQQLTRSLRLPVAAVDVAGAVDRAFDVAEQTLAAQRQLALTLAGVATRQLDLAVDTAAETAETAVAAAGSTVETDDTPNSATPRQDRKFDGRTYEERSVEELRERAAELQIEGRSSMSKDELIAALRSHRRSRSTRNDRGNSK